MTYEDNKAVVLMCCKVFDKEAILAATYLLRVNYYVEVEDIMSDYRVVINSRDSKPIDSSVVESFVNDCLDEQLRITLDNRTGKIRELIVKHAFKPLNLQKELELADGQ